MAVGEAILFFNHKLAEDFDYVVNRPASWPRMRFLSALWVGLLETTPV